MREKDDFYPTPPAMTDALLAYEFLEPCRVHEPACGNGAMSKVLRCYGHDVISEDLIDRGYGDSRRDFLMLQKRPCDYLMTNPPYKLAEEFRKQQAREQFNMLGSFGIVNQQDKGWNGYEY